MDVVATLRRALQWKAVGHAGTLDPPATGVLIVLCGKATRRADEFMDLPKEYVARVRFGLTTTTDDLAGETLSTQPVVDWSESRITQAIEKFIGGHLAGSAGDLGHQNRRPAQLRSGPPRQGCGTGAASRHRLRHRTSARASAGDRVARPLLARHLHSFPRPRSRRRLRLGRRAGGTVAHSHRPLPARSRRWAFRKFSTVPLNLWLSK